jgi:phosphoenolpyruvate synthase/pyruvate phosphate dikinase
MTTLIALSDPAAGDLAHCGGKAVGLHRLIASRLPVPPGFCIPTEVFRARVANDAAVQAARRALVSATDLASVREPARLLRDAVMRCDVGADLRAELRAMYREQAAHGPVAVRSSATAEDLAGASFAGQQDTVLDVQGDEALLDAVRRCWASLFSDRAIVYRRTHGVDESTISMAVVVQRMVKADCAGVLFTSDPVSGKRSVMVVEAVKGLGESLVSGHGKP